MHKRSKCMDQAKLVYGPLREVELTPLPDGRHPSKSRFVNLLMEVERKEEIKKRIPSSENIAAFDAAVKERADWAGIIYKANLKKQKKMRKCKQKLEEQKNLKK